MCFHPNLMIKCKFDNFPLTFWLNKHFKVDNEKKFAFKFLGPAERYVNCDIQKKYSYLNGEFLMVPCGNCIDCRLQYSKDWACRCMFEAKKYQFNYFLTLTYDDEHLPINVGGHHTLVPEHFTAFMKLLRKKLGNGIRFFGCGEYGSKSLRPHYHIILFNCFIPDLTINIPFVDESGKTIILPQKDLNGNYLQYSEIISSCWGKGSITIGDVSFQSCAYVARYCLKKVNDKDNDFYKLVHPEFTRMSNRPGIGFDYVASEYEKIYDSDKLIYLSGDKVAYSKPPRYYDKKLKELDSDIYDVIKYDRSISSLLSSELHYSIRSGSFSSELKNQERIKLNKIKSLKLRKN